MRPLSALSVCLSLHPLDVFVSDAVYDTEVKTTERESAP